MQSVWPKAKRSHFPALRAPDYNPVSNPPPLLEARLDRFNSSAREQAEITRMLDAKLQQPHRCRLIDTLLILLLAMT